MAKQKVSRLRPKSRSAMVRVGVDTGGTFTDFVFEADGRLQVFKLASTPADPSLAIVAGLRRIASLTGSQYKNTEVVHGTTVGTNALLQRRGARTALVTTKGFEDVLAIGRQARPELYNLNAVAPQPIVPDELRFGVAERVTAYGDVLIALSDKEIKSLMRKLRAARVESIAISLLFCFVHPEHERRIADALETLGVPLSIAHEILPEYREYERTSTVAINAYLQPLMGQYLNRLSEAALDQIEVAPRRTRSTTNKAQSPKLALRVMQSSGGSISAAVAAAEPVRTILSGPAGGIVGALAAARTAGFERIITFDMGGTSTDVALCDRDGIRTTNEANVAGLPVAIPMMDIHTVGAGGGSIARVDEGGSLRVGPESAGADPGPACYGRSLLPTVTDAHVVLGHFGGAGLLGGEFALDEARAYEALKRLAYDMSKAARRKIGIHEAAQGVLSVVNTNMDRALRRISVERGFDPREFALLPFGGAGGLHAVDLARALRIPKIIVPASAGALSAIGVLNADVIKDQSCTLMFELEADSDKKLERAFVEMERSSRMILRREGFDYARQRHERSIAARYKGQSFELEIKQTSGDIAAAFHLAHRTRYGYEQVTSAIEIVSARVRSIGVIEKSKQKKMRTSRREGFAKTNINVGAFFDGKKLSAVVYRRGELPSGARLRGPCIVSEYSSTTLITAGADARMDAFGKSNHSDQAMKHSFDPTTLEIYRALYTSVAEEMGISLRRTAFSPNIKERRDYSCAVFDRDGHVIAQGDHMPVHLGSMPMAVAAALRAIDIGPGDVVAINDPFAGGTHLPDVTLVAGVFGQPLAPDPRPLFFVANRAHHADIGGATPGSMGLATDVYGEGVRIPSIRLVRAGEINDDVMRLILANVRGHDERRGDFQAQIGSLKTGATRLLEIVERRGAEEAIDYAAHLIAYSARLMRNTIGSIPDGDYEAEDALDDDGVSDEEVPIHVRITIKGDRARVDFTGSAPQVAGAINAVEAITVSAVSYVFRCLVGGDIPASAGLVEPIEVIAPSGTVVNANHPASVAGGNVETSQRIVDVVFRALAQALPDRIPAASQGTMNNLTIGGIDTRTAKEFSYYETVAGGMGARPQLDGMNAVHTHMTNSLNTPAEALEYAYPLRVREYRIRKHSGGKGKQRGGDGVVREIETLVPARMSLLADRRKSGPYGLQSGEPGQPGRAAIIRKGRARKIASKGSWQLEAGDRVRIETPGGGGFGNEK